ncbi:MAG: DUF2264 domain-containing protein, partial [Chthoniobacterales bacterium]
STRDYWIHIAKKLSFPLLTHAGERTLRKNIPVVSNGKWDEMLPESPLESLCYYEGFCRLLVGIAPWLELNEAEAQPVSALARAGLKSLFDPSSPDYYDCGSRKAVVDTAILAQGLLYAPRVLWEPLEPEVKANILNAFRTTRAYLPHPSNWLLFSALIETALYVFGAKDWDRMRIEYALRQHLQWYKGDGFYGDGPHFHADYYNSFVIQPMMVDIIRHIGDQEQWHYIVKPIMDHARRYAEVIERFISPEGTYPPIGRSISYRFAALQGLSHMAYLRELSPELAPAQVREALTAVIRRSMEAPGTFDKDGWLQIGLCGNQPSLGEFYICTGSVYLCSTGLLPLGLPASDPFWSAPPAPWTAKKIWDGVDMPLDPNASIPD